MSTPNTERFLDAFIAIENHLERLVDAGRYVSFVNLVDQASPISPAVRHFRDDLKEYAELRNVLVHERRGGLPIAEPYLATVESIEMIMERVLEPPVLLPAFARDVVVCAPTDQVGLVAGWMRDRSISQVPVYDDGKLVALLTAGTLARWLGAVLADGAGLVQDVSIVEVLEHTEHPDSFVLLPRGASVYDALSAFDVAVHTGASLAAIIVTRNARPTEQPLSILTASDVPRLFHLADNPGERPR